jgi:translation initiation factor IF-1
MAKNTENVERDRLEFEGEVIEANKGIFRVQIYDHDNYVVTCSLSGKVRVNGIKLVVGDRVLVEVSPYELTKGRIIYRM